MHNMKLIQSELLYYIMHTYAYLELFKLVFSLNNLNHAKRIKF